jgi:hypothetical protein
MDRFKVIVLILITLIISGSAGANIIKQYKTLDQAKLKNEEIKLIIADLKTQNINLINQIEYATSSAHLEQQMRDKFGMGSENDAWIILPEEKKNNLIPEAKFEDNKPNFLKWLELFTI